FGKGRTIWEPFVPRSVASIRAGLSANSAGPSHIQMTGLILRPYSGGDQEAKALLVPSLPLVCLNILYVKSDLVCRDFFDDDGRTAGLRDPGGEESEILVGFRAFL